jgi:hypothetical protein
MVCDDTNTIENNNNNSQTQKKKKKLKKGQVLPEQLSGNNERTGVATNFNANFFSNQFMI